MSPATGIREAFFLSAMLIATPAFSQEGGLDQPSRAASSGLRLFIEVGVRNRSDSTVKELVTRLPQLIESLSQRDEIPAELEALTTSLKLDNMPATIRLFVPERFNRKAKEPPYYVTVVDTAAPIPMQRILGPAAAPGGAANKLFLSEHRVDGGHRYLIGKGRDALGSHLDRLGRGDTPATKAAFAKFFRRVADAPAYVLFDFGAIGEQRHLSKLRAVGGPQASLFALGVSRSGEKWNMDLHWGGRANGGVVSQFLPKKAPGASSLHELLPWKPAVALQGNLGPQAAKQLQRFRFPIRRQQRAVLQQLLSGWEGEIGFYQPDPEADWQAPAGASGPAAVSQTMVFLLRVDAEQTQKIATSIASTISRRARLDDESGTFRFDMPSRSIHIGQRNGIVAVSTSGDADTAARHLTTILANTEGDARRSASRIDRDLAGPVQCWVSPEAGHRIHERIERAQSRRGRSGRGAGYEFGRRLAKQFIRDGYAFSLNYDRSGFRLRLQF